MEAETPDERFESPEALAETVKRLESEMKEAAKRLDFERAAELRDRSAPSASATCPSKTEVSARARTCKTGAARIPARRDVRRSRGLGPRTRTWT